uniref:Methyltransferase-related protein n=1 Tax=Cucumis melo TaxID=3656 RepID=A0A9I9CV25_CUCME
MCPLRFILVFLSAILAGYFAWRSASSSSSSSFFFSSSSSDIFQATEAPDKSAPQNENRSVREDGFGVKRMVENGFWTFVDMASGRFLWRNMNESILNKNKQVN